MMPQTLADTPRVNHEAEVYAPVQDGDVHEAMAKIADIIVESGEGLTLDSLIKAFWRTYSTPEGNIVSIHEGRSNAAGPGIPEDAFTRLSGRMDEMAQSLGSLSDRVGSSYRDYAPETAAQPMDNVGDAQMRRHRDDDRAGAGNAPRIETSLPDRAQFEIALEENYRIARSEVEPLSVAICSVSRIEQIIEHHGLHTATRLMDRVASTLSLATRGECYSARKSNSEFIMLARGITISQFCDVLEQSIYDLSVRRWHDKFSNRTLGMVDLHVGIAHVFDFANPSQAMRAADLAHERALAEVTSNLVLAETADLAID